VILAILTILLLGWRLLLHSLYKTSYGYLGFLSDKKISAGSEGKNGHRIFHPMNRNTLDNLAAYLIEHGECASQHV